MKNEDVYIKYGFQILAGLMAGWLVMIAVANNEIPIKQTGFCIALFSAVFIVAVTYRRNDQPASARKPKQSNEPEADDDEPEYQPRVRVTGDSD
jgi:hypothetical protein